MNERHISPDNSPTQQGHLPPPGAATQGILRFFEAFHLPRVMARRSGLVIVVLLLIVFGQQIDIYRISATAGPKPYFLEHDPASGAVWESDRVAEAYTPQAADITFQLRRWAIRFQQISIDPNQTLKVDEPAAYQWTIGAAQQEYSQYFDKDDNVADLLTNAPGTTREITENSTSYSPDGKTAFMIITRQWKLNGADTHSDTKLLRINFIRVPVSKDEARDNPLGLRIVDFSVTPYYGPTGSK